MKSTHLFTPHTKRRVGPSSLGTPILNSLGLPFSYYDQRTLTIFWKSVRKNGHGGCWEWVGNKNQGSYGRFTVNGKTFLAHRFGWEIYHDKIIPSGLLICHHCDNPSCVNPKHLFLGTLQDNIHDMINKGRRRIHWDKEKNKLTDSIIKEIREKYTPQKYSMRHLAREYGLTTYRIKRILNLKVSK